MQPNCEIVTVVTAGTPVQLTTFASINAAAMLIAPFVTNGAGPYWVGIAGLNKATGVNVITPLASSSNSFTFPPSQNGMNTLHPADYYLDSTNSGDKFYVTWWVE